MSRYAIFDLDNCISNDEWRLPHIRFDLPDNVDEKWAKYHQLCGGDNAEKLHLVRAAQDRELKLAFVTMRPEAVRAATIQWLERKVTQGPYLLLMRPDGDHRPSVQLKREAVEKLRAGGHEVVEAYDDRADIVDMYRAIGITAARVLRIHNVSCHRPPPATAEEDAAPEPMPIAPPTRGEQPAPQRAAGCVCGPVPAYPFTTDPIAAFNKTTGRTLEDGGGPEPAERGNLTFGAAAPPGGLRAGDFLRQAADTYAKKNAEYGDDYRKFGEVAAALFPEGLTVQTVDEWNRLALFIWALSKMGRYAKNMSTGGHADSALDLSVYGAMLREMTT